MTIHRRTFFAAAILAAATAFAPASASAQDRWPFEAGSFKKAQAEGKSILIEVFAPWCPTCRQQSPIIGELAKKPEFSEMEIFVVDFDNQKDVLRSLQVSRQSTLITFKGEKETGRAVAITSPKAIEDLMRTAL